MITYTSNDPEHVIPVIKYGVIGIRLQGPITSARTEKLDKGEGKCADRAYMQWFRYILNGLVKAQI